MFLRAKPPSGKTREFSPVSIRVYGVKSQKGLIEDRDAILVRRAILQADGRNGTGYNGKPSLFDFNEIDVIASLESKFFAHVGWKGDAAVEGDHCGGHLEPLPPL